MSDTSGFIGWVRPATARGAWRAVASGATEDAAWTALLAIAAGSCDKTVTVAGKRPPSSQVRRQDGRPVHRLPACVVKKR